MIIALSPTLRESRKKAKNESNKNPESALNFSAIWDEAACWRMYFSWSKALTIILLGLLPSVWDVSSDYIYAQTWDDNGYNPRVRALVYFFICLPHLMTLLDGANSIITCCFDFPSARTSLRLLGKSAGLGQFVLLLAATAYGAVYLGLHHPDAYAYLAVPSAAATISIKMAGVLVQGPEAKRALTLLTAREGQFESTFQIAIVFFSFFLTPRALDWTVYSSLCSSFLTIGKGGVENLLTFGKDDKVTDTSLLQKLKLLARYGPVFVLTTFFRIGCLTSTTFLAGVGSDGYGVNAFASQAEFAVPLVFVVPLVVLLLCKCFLPTLTVGEVVQGVISEAFTITVWGKNGREGSRGVQLAMAVYYLVLHTVAAFATLSTIPDHRASLLLTSFSITSVSCGWIAFVLFVFQILLMDRSQ